MYLDRRAATLFPERSPQRVAAFAASAATTDHTEDHMFARHARAAAAFAIALGAICAFAVLPSSASAQTGARNCVAQPAAIVGQPPAMQCYDSFAAAIAAATDGVVQLPASTPVGPLPASVLTAAYVAASRPAGPLTSVILSIDYTGTNESGSSLTWTEPSGCGTYSSSSMPTGWNDVVSSVSNFNGCGTTLYQNTGFSGSTFSIAVDATANTLGSFNRTASSQKWCPSNSC
jgi:hypothetical protein